MRRRQNRGIRIAVEGMIVVVDDQFPVQPAPDPVEGGEFQRVLSGLRNFDRRGRVSGDILQRRDIQPRHVAAQQCAAEIDRVFGGAVRLPAVDQRTRFIIGFFIGGELGSNLSASRNGIRFPAEEVPLKSGAFRPPAHVRERTDHHPVAEKRSPPEGSAIPRQAGWIPLLHLVYALSLAGAALRPARRILFLALFELGSFALSLFALIEGNYYLAGLAGSVFLLSYAAIFYEGWFRTQERMPLPFFLIPGANLAWLLRELLRLTGWFRLAAAFTILATWVVAVLLALRREFIAAGVLALLSYLVSAAATLFPAGERE